MAQGPADQELSSGQNKDFLNVKMHEESREKRPRSKLKEWSTLVNPSGNRIRGNWVISLVKSDNDFMLGLDNALLKVTKAMKTGLPSSED